MNRDSRESTLTDRTDVVPPERTPYRTRKLVYLLKGNKSNASIMLPMIFIALSSFISQWNEFFHSRVTVNSSSAFQWIRYLRIAYGLCLLWDRILLSLDFNMFFLYPTTTALSSSSTTTPIATLPLIPCQQYMFPVSETVTYPYMVNTDFPYSPLCSIASYFPFSYHSYIFYLFHIVGIVSAMLLIWNVYPKLQLVLLHINMMSFHFHSFIIWDGEDRMCRVLNFMFLFLPLQLPSSKPISQDEAKTCATTTGNGTASYPIWPVRLFQIEMCCILAGAGYSKLASEEWRSGNALYHVRSVSSTRIF